ncbi:uncharacterized protein LOC113147313, partial [Cyclospora cayetanensis]|uniref:Uncharacterized protein LOC113147313 n=1 Tax=Cyclospora cayetanensis TaxID=88456 RepID=A0A6P6S0V0_9EIME
SSERHSSSGVGIAAKVFLSACSAYGIFWECRRRRILNHELPELRRQFETPYAEKLATDRYDLVAARRLRCTAAVRHRIQETLNRALHNSSSSNSSSDSSNNSSEGSAADAEARSGESSLCFASSRVSSLYSAAVSCMRRWGLVRGVEETGYVLLLSVRHAAGEVLLQRLKELRESITGLPTEPLRKQQDQQQQLQLPSRRFEAVQELDRMCESLDEAQAEYAKAITHLSCKGSSCCKPRSTSCSRYLSAAEFAVQVLQAASLLPAQPPAWQWIVEDLLSLDYLLPQQQQQLEQQQLEQQQQQEKPPTLHQQQLDAAREALLLAPRMGPLLFIRDEFTEGASAFRCGMKEYTDTQERAKRRQ